MARNNIQAEDVTAVILAGGEGRRMQGRDKGLITWNQRPLIEYALETIPSDIAHTLISCNRNIANYQDYGETVQDSGELFQGPLAGIHAAMQRTTTPYIMVIPCDTPLAPKNILLHLITTLNASNADICYVDDGERKQYLFALIRTNLLFSLNEYLSSGNRQVHRWYKQNNYVEANLHGQQLAFKNVNSNAEL
ncbi:Molybdenum cofactor guanylyltransferase [Zhongshania aliphaticivorans]|uniref:Molybdenum cofactor guanylyltransferase n=1 Tax=Zhongshania aliphaticivorans TaxID=1470434 RepID=A0A5S9NDI6_9GAMM|nr:molybdenum cofactor guanylyltransferase MobA [Zhongshania aliphaticivorans]CAA0087386.1 Molybdenum cofactor guanylyltransferase [Zhongshania aliphaticivorans]CAA0114734.1 Molybdenum cofactor guanylyltransferase [Zhongshania aliphaticivorans]